MSNGAFKSSGKASLASIEAIRAQADSLLCLLDESGLSEAAALMASAVDAIDAYLRHRPKNDTSEINRED